MTGIRQLFRVSVVALLALASASGALADPSITWPQGWVLRERPMPLANAGETFGGSNRLALKIDSQGQLLAAFNLITLKIKDGDRPALADQMAAMLATIGEGYATKGLQVVCSPSLLVTLGGVPAQQSVCQVLNNDTAMLEQVMLVAVTPHTVQSLSFTASPDNFDRFTPAFAATRNSLSGE